MPAPQDIHSCSWFCELPNCVLAQRDELRERIAELQNNGARLLAVADSAAAHQREMIEAACAPLHERIAELERDAARYRWLRGPDRIEVAYLINKSDADLDAAIDAAMEGK